MKPYPHLYVKPVFRPDFYNCIMSHVPPSAITERVYNRLPNDRYQLTIQVGLLCELNPVNQP
jgi:hypothetical protein